MRIRLKKLILGLLATGMAMGASAATTSTTASTSSPLTFNSANGSSVATFGDSFTTVSSFVDHFSFNLTNPANAAGAIFSLATFGTTGAITSNLDITNFSLTGVTSGQTYGGHLNSTGLFENWTIMANKLTAGSYLLDVTGQATQASTANPASYSGFVQVENVSPVPEPATYAMLLAGLAVIGATVVRSKKNTS